MITRNNKTTSSIFKGNQTIDKVMKGTLVVYEAFKKLIASGVPPITLKKCKNSNLIDYKIYGNSEKKQVLPNEYQQVEYIQTTGTQYIDSGVPLKNRLKTIVDWIYEETSSSNSYTGAHIGSPGNRWLIGSQRQNNIYFFAVGTGNTATGIKFGNRDVVEAYWEDKASYIKVNGVQSTVSFSHLALAEEPNYTFYIGAVNRDGNASSKSKLTIYNWKFYQDNVLIRDFIPCYRKSDNEIGMYDLVNDKFYTNDGTGVFLKGNEIATEIESVGDYVETTGKYTIPIKVSPTLYNFNLENIDYITYNSGAISRYGFDLGVLEEGKYTFDFEYETRPTYVGLIKEVDGKATSEYITTTATGRDETPFTFTSDGIAHFYIIFMSSTIKNLTQAQNHWKQVKVAFLQKDTKIQTNITNIYLTKSLRKMGDYADYIDYKNQKVIALVDKKTFDGSENWELHTTISGGCVFRLDGVLTPLLNTPQTSTHMTHFVVTNIYSTSKFDVGLYRFSSNTEVTKITGNRLYVSSPNTTVEGFKEWLSQNKPSIYYPLETTIEETIELPNILLNKGTNIIEVDTNILPSNMVVEYYGKSVNQLLDETTNNILNEILNDNTETEKDISDIKIEEILDKIIGG